MKLLLHRIYKARVAYLFVAPAFILLFVFIGYPLIESLVLSLYKWDGIMPRQFIGLGNFRELITDSVLWKALTNNLRFMLFTTIGTVVIGFLLATAIERRVGGWAFFKVVYFLPVMMSMTVVGLLWGRFLDPTLGPINIMLSSLGVDKPPIWLGDPKTTLNTIIAVSIWQYSGFPMIIFLAQMENIDPEIHDAATIDSVNEIQRLWYITIPLVKHVFAMIVLLQMIFSFKVFDIVWTMTMGGPGDASTVLGLYLYRVAFQYTWFGYGSTVAVFMFVIIFTLSLLYRKFVKIEETLY